MTVVQVSPTQLLCVDGAQRLLGSLRALDEALRDFLALWNIRGCIWAGARSWGLFANSSGDTGVTQPQHCRGACAGVSFGMI